MARRLQSFASALTGAVAAAGVMYYFDASSGRRRRTDLGQRSTSAARRGLWRLQAASRDLAHRAYGLGARATALLHRGEVAPSVLVERVRSRLGRVVSHPGAVHVSADGPHTVRLTGAVLAWEHGPLRRAVAEVPGVEAIRDELEVHESAQHVSALQGGPRRPLREPAAESGGTAALRLLMALAGSSLLLGGSRQRGTLGAVGAAAGSALLLRSVAAPRRPAPRHRGRTLEVCQTLHVHSSVESVYAALRHSDRLVALLPALRALRHRGDGATQWSVHDPQGWPLEWTAVVTELQPNRQIAWRTTDDSILAQWGMAWLEPIDAQQTRLHLYVSLRPVPGRTGQALRRLLATGPQGELTENLGRLRQYLESSTAAVSTGAPTATGTTTGTRTTGTGAGTPGTANPDLLTAWTQPLDGRTH
ncbi:MAG TPA: hypothetical protein VHY19_01745 [Steroidobacteraceae bacterium]|jgi:uncharacterized membrane protein|nr:hypothetical protein [Steroidobacteraceae bacterium]